jgi:thioredoxin-related protein
MLKLILITLFFITFLSEFSPAQPDSQYTPVTKFDPSRNPSKDLEEAIVEAKSSNKRIILDVGGEWCIWCHRIDDFVEKNKDIKNFLDDNFIVVKINFSKENENKEFLSKYPQIPGYPHFFVLEKDGALLHSQDTGELEQGKSYNHEKMMNFFKKWAPAESKSG